MGYFRNENRIINITIKEIVENSTFNLVKRKIAKSQHSKFAKKSNNNNRNNNHNNRNQKTKNTMENHKKM